MPSWDEELSDSRLEPDGEAIREEEPPRGNLSTAEEAILAKTWRDLRRLRPDLYVVLADWVELFKLRDESSQYSHGVYRGFYAEVSRKLGVTEPAVQYRLKRAKLWFAERLKRNNFTRGFE